MAIREAGGDPAALDYILLTHQDIDHVGCVKDILPSCPRAVVACHEDEAPYIRGDLTPIKYAALPEDHPFRQAYARRVVPVDQLLRDGDHLPLSGGITIIHTPGHTPGHMCLYVHAARALIAGDALNIQDDALSGPNPVYTQDMAQAYRSLEKLITLPIDCVYTFHGGAYRGDVTAALNALIAAGPGRI
jgi:glyoxylase-like metal-dependent hydrolase (beta-lactamase superfamily II)